MEEVLSEGKNFRLLQESELPEVVEFMSQFLPHSIKVSCQNIVHTSWGF